MLKLYFWVAIFFSVVSFMSANTDYLFIGSYTNQISSYSLSSQTGLQRLASSEVGENPSWLVISKSRKYVFAVNEVTDYEGEYSGSISAFEVSEQGSLKLINR